MEESCGGRASAHRIREDGARRPVNVASPKPVEEDSSAIGSWTKGNRRYKRVSCWTRAVACSFAPGATEREERRDRGDAVKTPAGNPRTQVEREDARERRRIWGVLVFEVSSSLSPVCRDSEGLLQARR